MAANNAKFCAQPLPPVSSSSRYPCFLTRFPLIKNPSAKPIFRFSTRRLYDCPHGFSVVRPAASRSEGGGDSYLDMWKKALEREELVRLEEEEERRNADGDDFGKKSEEFKKILEVPEEERNRVQKLQVIDRAAAAIAAARALISEKPTAGDSRLRSSVVNFQSGSDVGDLDSSSGSLSIDVDLGYLDSLWSGGDGSSSTFSSDSRNGDDDYGGGTYVGTSHDSVGLSEASTTRAPGPDFWSWSPPTDAENAGSKRLQRARLSSSMDAATPVMEKEKSMDMLSIPLESRSLNGHFLPPFQSLAEVDRVPLPEPTYEAFAHSVEENVDAVFSSNSAEAIYALNSISETSAAGENLDGTRWWKESGVEQRSDGVVCRWTLVRGISANGEVEWEDKYWEASDEYDYKELGSEKSGRDASGNVWREFWRESMWQDIGTGLLNIEKTADKWGKNSMNEEWQEQWWEHYNAAGFAEKWAHKWCCIDPSTSLEAGHAHVWHERWGEKYDGKGSSTKYTDKWAERNEGGAWTKWGDKWDESFNEHAHGVKQGETWWQGAHGESWNRTWGEGHDGSGWVHKYGKSSSGEHWDTHLHQDTWYEKYPHYGFHHCFENSQQLQQVKKPGKTDL